MDAMSPRSEANLSGEIAVRGGCQHDCPDTCAWQVTVRDGVAIRLAADADHPYTRGSLCPKVHRYLDRVYNPDRIIRPLRRIGEKGSGRFAEITWEDALDEIAIRLSAAMATHGRATVMPFSHQGSMGILQERSLDRRFFATLGATRLLRNYCGWTASAAIKATLGSTTPMLPEDIVHSRLIVLWGTNTVLTNPHLWRLITGARKEGARVVAVDPLLSQTARAADLHIRPRPGTDAALALGLMYVILRDETFDREYVEAHTSGLPRLREAVADITPEACERTTGVPAHLVEALATEYATVRPAVIRLMLGLEKHRHGAATVRAITSLPALVGAWRDRGGGLLHLTNDLHFEALNLDGVQIPALEDPAVRSVHWAQIGHALTSLEDPPITALIVYNSNPAVSAPETKRVVAGLSRDDLFTVVHEQTLTETARYADIVLPATTMIEHWDLLRSWGQTYLTLNRPAIEPAGDAVSVTELFRRVATALGMQQPHLHTPDLDLIRTALDSDHPHLRGITFDRLLEGGWAPLALPEDWRPFAQGGFGTPSGRFEFAGGEAADLGLGETPEVRVAESSPHYPLSLIASKRERRLINTTYTELHGHPEAIGVSVHPEDADFRGIGDGDAVRIYNAMGEITAVARLSSEDVPPGVIAASFGWPPLPGVRDALNTLTSDTVADISGGGTFYDTRVELASASALPQR